MITTKKIPIENTQKEMRKQSKYVITKKLHTKECNKGGNKGENKGQES